MTLKFTSDAELLKFSRKFANSHIVRFEKDIAICLKGKKRRGKNSYTHAYFPALIACIGILDLFSGLHAGRIEYHGLHDLKRYTKKFLPPAYTDLTMSILYNCFRHKVAHLGHPYPVFDTNSRPNDFTGEPRRLIGWTVQASSRNPAISLVALKKPKLLSSAPKAWNVKYDWKIRVSVKQLSLDIIQSIQLYLIHLSSDEPARQKFEKCMNQYFHV